MTVDAQKMMRTPRLAQKNLEKSQKRTPLERRRLLVIMAEVFNDDLLMADTIADS